MWEDATAGIVNEWSADVSFRGAENNGKVTCYLDSLLFALYAHLDSFEVCFSCGFGFSAENEGLLNHLICLSIRTAG